MEPCSYSDVALLAAGLGVPETVATVLVRRGFTDPQRARRFLEASDRHDPYEIDGIGEAAVVILEHARAGNTIAVHGDYDVDGVSSTALMVRALRDLGADVTVRLPSRQEDGYGLSIATVERVKKAGASLLITTDCGVGAIEQVARAKQLGMDVIVTDHHRPGAELPDCPIVHPGLADYPCPELCATGVAYKLAQALFAQDGRDVGELERELDIVALATVADVVPLVDENRALVRDGLRAVAGAARPGLRALLRVTGIDPQSVTEHSLGFVLGPRINAAGRLYRADAALELLLTNDEDRAFEIARELDSINRERQSVEAEMLFEAERVVDESGQLDQSVLVLASEGWHSGVIGIVASRLVERHNRPCVMIALDDQGRGKGSARSIPAYDLHGGLGACDRHLLRYGGHRAAAGLEIDAAEVGPFRDALAEHARDAISDQDLVRVERVDAVVPGDALTLDLAEQLEALRPFGMGNPAVNLMVPAARVSDVRALGKERKHSQFTLTSGGARAKVVAFGSGERPGGLGRVDRTDVRFDIVARLERNEWQGAVEQQLILRSLYEVEAVEPPAPAADAEWRRRVWQEFGADLSPKVPAPGGAARKIVDRRGSGVFGQLAALLATGERVVIGCSDAARRRVALERLGIARFGNPGVSVLEYEELQRDSRALLDAHHIFLLDPPPSEGALRLLRDTGPGFLHLGWGSAEVEFATRSLEAAYSLRDTMRAIYSSIAAAPGGLAGDRLAAALCGSGASPRSAAVVGRSLRVMTELGLVGVEGSSDTFKCTIIDQRPTGRRVDLESSQAFSSYTQTCREGLRYLSEQTSRRSHQRAA